MGCAELLGKLTDEGFGSVGWEAAGVAGGVHHVEQELGEALSVLGRRGGFVEDGEFFGAFEAFAGELVEADGYGLAEVHGEMAGGFRGEEGDGYEEGTVAKVFVGKAGFFGAEEEGYAWWDALVC